MTKEGSTVNIGDIVFCSVQPQHQYYAHIVLEMQWCHYTDQDKYWIGNIKKSYNGWVFKEHIFGILVAVQRECDGRYYHRPHPKMFYHVVQPMVKADPDRAKELCEPL